MDRVIFSKYFNTSFLNSILSRKNLTYFFLIGALFFGVSTYAALAGWPPFGPNTKTIIILLYIDLFFLLFIGFIIARHLIMIWLSKREGHAGSRLHIRLISHFGFLAMAPTITVVIFSALFFNLGLESWFSDRVRTALKSSFAIAQSYLHEHQQAIKADVLSMANDLNRNAHKLQASNRRFSDFLNAQAMLRSLPEAIVFNTQGVLARSSLSFSLEFDGIVKSDLEMAGQGKTIVRTTNNNDRVRALIRLDNFPSDTFLYVGRIVDPAVISNVRKSRRAVLEYENLEGKRSELQILFSLIFIVVGLLLLMASIWGGLILATRLTKPIGELIHAANQIKSGQLSSRVNVPKNQDELQILGQAFNSMAGRLEKQQEKLIETNKELDQRREFTEAVLSGVSSGVIGIDVEGRLDLPNKRASELLEKDLREFVGQHISIVLPELEGLLRLVRIKGGSRAEKQMDISFGDHTRSFLVRISVQRKNYEVAGYVITLDDISDLMDAQRKAAWGDVARRIAHEIKNPLTPIQLATERLRRKYLQEIQSDKETFDNCTETIIRQVGDIERMVNAFSSFARMPSPTLTKDNLYKVCLEAVKFQKNLYSDIDFNFESSSKDISYIFDKSQINQVLNNILQNAILAIKEQQKSDKDLKGLVDIKLKKDREYIDIEILDNGCGLPNIKLDKLTEPYITTREQGTGLGLAIVKRIIEDHGGTLKLIPNPKEKGTLVLIKFSLKEK